MFNRPRCRDYTPLFTQQLRLRNLIQISGHNIICSNEKCCSVYYTLHMTSMSSPFFTSCKVDTPNNAMWPELNLQNHCNELRSKSICVRVWQHINDKTDKDGENLSSHPDKPIFIWGVYFSGLIEIPNRASVVLKSNSLVFQIHGGLFTAAESVLCETTSLTAGPNSILPNNQKICDEFIENGDRRLGSSPSRSERTALPSTTKTVMEIERPRKIRYTYKEFLNTEIKSSYVIKKLLHIQELQRRIKNQTESAKELKEKICMKSAFCLNLELIACKSMMYYRQYMQKQKSSGLGRTLDRLLHEQFEPPDPDTIMRAQKIRRDIEVAKFRGRLLVQERDQTKIVIRRLESRLNQISDQNIEMESYLMSNYRILGREKEATAQEKLLYVGKREILSNLRSSLQLRRFQLLRELIEIYDIKKTRDCYTINGIYLPDAESYSPLISPTDLRVALGSVAHIVLLCSTILNIPLRNEIINKGSLTKIIDNIKVLLPNQREFPLFSKDTPPPNDLLYGVFLLNQNIAQLKFSLGISKGDIRATLPNLYQILNVTSLNIPKMPPHLPDVLSRMRLDDDSLSASNSSINLDSVNGCPVTVVDKTNKTHRICRSVESFKDATSSTDSKFNSEPLLSNILPKD